MSNIKMGKYRKSDLFKLPDGVYRLESHCYIRVKGNGKYRNYFFRYTDIDGTQRDMALGSARKVPLTEVQQKVYYLKTVLKMARGANALTEVNGQTLFKEYSLSVIDTLSEVKLWKNPVQKKSWVSSIVTYSHPILGEKSVQEITRRDILKVLKPIWITKTMTASRLRGRLERIFSYAISEGAYSGPNPAAWNGNLDMFLPSPGKCSRSSHFRSLSFEALKKLIPVLLSNRATAAKSLLFGILTATRTVEFTQAHWREIDWKNKIWNCPPNRRKDGKNEVFRVPLSQQSVSLLKWIKERSNSEYIFSVNHKTPIRRETPRKFLRENLHSDGTMHGMRSTFRDWCAENGVDLIAAEKSLMHSTGNQTVVAYQRSDLLEVRREIMQRWADALFEAPKNEENFENPES